MKITPEPASNSNLSLGQWCPFVSLTDLFLKSAQAFTNRPALWTAGEALTYGELRARANAIARILLEHDLQPEKRRCAVFAYRTAVAYAGVLGTSFAGKAYVPLNPRFPAERSRAVLEAADVAAMVIDGRCAEAARTVLTDVERPMLLVFPEHDSPPEWVARQHRVFCRGDLEMPEKEVRAAGVLTDDGAYLLFTSGSTGSPKGVLLTHRNAVSYVSTAINMFAPRPDDRFTQLFDLTFDVSVHDMFVCWAAGACLYCVPEEALIGPGPFVRKHALTFWFSVPTVAEFMRKFAMLEADAMPSLRVSIFAGEALPAAIANAFQKAAPNSALYNLYGPTEATVSITAARWRPGDEPGPGGIVPIGHPFAGQAAAVVDQDLHEVPDGQIGELCVSGSQLAQGYWRDPELTQERFVVRADAKDPARRWYRTGDLVTRDPARGLFFHGRLDNQVQIRGYRVEIAEVELAVREASEAGLVAVIGWPQSQEQGVLGLVAFVVEPKRPPAAIIDLCRKRLPDYMVPTEINVIAHMPLNANGKIDYRALREQRGCADA